MPGADGSIAPSRASAGCPFAGDELVGNIATETVVRTLAERGVETGLTLAALTPALVEAGEDRDKYSHE